MDLIQTCTQCRAYSFVSLADTGARSHCTVWCVTAIISSYQDPLIPSLLVSLSCRNVSDLCSYRLPPNYLIILFAWEIIITCVVLWGKLLKLISCFFFFLISLFSLSNKGSVLSFAPSVRRETCGRDRCAVLFYCASQLGHTRHRVITSMQ